MSPARRGSRIRFLAYRRAAVAGAPEGTSVISTRRGRPRHRAVGELLVTFWSFLDGIRSTAAVSLVGVTVAAALRLFPPAATGFAIDYILGHRPAPVGLAGMGVTATPRTLLTAVAIGLYLAMVLSTAIGTWGRYLSALANRRLQSGLRRRVLAHILRLPIHRIRAYQSGGLTSVLREDVGAAAGLLNTMVYQPSRSLIQVVGKIGRAHV